MVACYFIDLFCQPSELAQALELATGNSYSSDSLQRLGERAYAIQRAFNVRATGITAADDRLPDRMLEPFAEGEAQGIVPDIQPGDSQYVRATRDRSGPLSRVEAAAISFELVSFELTPNSKLRTQNCIALL
jgi:aldehyde:ferredoxin oxidoreductase